MKYKLLIKIPLILSLIFFASCSNNEVKHYNSVDDKIAEATIEAVPIKVEDLHALLDTADILVIDVREGFEFNPGYIPVAINIPRGVIEFKMGNDVFWENQMLYPPTKDGAIVLVCKKGKRSILTIKALKELGYTNVKYLKGGFKSWETKYPLEQEKNLELTHDTGEEVGGC